MREINSINGIFYLTRWSNQEIKVVNNNKICLPKYPTVKESDIGFVINLSIKTSDFVAIISFPKESSKVKCTWITDYCEIIDKNSIIKCKFTYLGNNEWQGEVLSKVNKAYILEKGKFNKEFLGEYTIGKNVTENNGYAHFGDTSVITTTNNITISKPFVLSAIPKEVWLNFYSRYMFFKFGDKICSNGLEYNSLYYSYKKDGVNNYIYNTYFTNGVDGIFNIYLDYTHATDYNIIDIYIKYYE